MPDSKMGDIRKDNELLWSFYAYKLYFKVYYIIIYSSWDVLSVLMLVSTFLLAIERLSFKTIRKTWKNLEWKTWWSALCYTTNNIIFDWNKNSIIFASPIRLI